VLSILRSWLAAPIVRSRVSANTLLGSENPAAVWGRFVMLPVAHNLRHDEGIRELDHWRASYIPLAYPLLDHLPHSSFVIASVGVNYGCLRNAASRRGRIEEQLHIV